MAETKTAAETSPNPKTHGKCPWCGCPYYNDHVPDCPGIITIPIIERIDALERKLKDHGIIT